MTEPDPTRALLALANRLHGLLTSIARPDLAGHIQRAADTWTTRDLTVVVCGDVKRGKSSLLNALLERPDLLPVDADVATSAQIYVSRGDPPSAAVTAWSDSGETQTRQIALAEIEDYGAVTGDARRREGVSRIHVHLDHPLLEAGLCLVDTPGFGGLAAGHRELAAAVIGTADVVLFTVAADEPVRRSELELLGSAAVRAGVLAVAMTRSDAVPDADESARELQARLAAFAGAPDDGVISAISARLAGGPIFPVSARLALRVGRTMREGRQDVAASLRARSGLDPLVTFLTAEAARPARVRAARLMAVLDDTSRIAAADLTRRAGDSEGDEVRRELRSLQRTHEEVGGVAARCRAAIGADCQRMQTLITRQIGADLSEAEAQLRSQLSADAHPDRLLAELPAQVESTLQAAWLRASDRLATGIAELSQRTAADLELDAQLDAGSGAATAVPDLGRIDLAVDVRARFDLVDHALPAATSSAFIAGIVAPLLGPAGLVIGAATGGALLVARLLRQARRQAVQAKLQLLGTALRDARQDLGAEVNLHLLEARQQLEGSVDRIVQERRAALTARRDELEESARASAAERTARRNEAARQLGRLRALHEELARLRPAVVAAAATDPAPGGNKSGDRPLQPTAHDRTENDDGL